MAEETGATFEGTVESRDSRSLLDFYRYDVLPRLKPEQIYVDPAHDW